MDKHQFFAILEAEIFLNATDFKILLEAAKNHYDSTIKGTVEVGGHLYGEFNKLEL